MTLILANWKSNGDLEAVAQWSAVVARDFPTLQQQHKDRYLSICSPYVFIPEFYRWLQSICDDHFSLGAQDISPFDAGAHTGEIHGAMLKQLHCRYVLIGHSERRADFGEDNQLLATKLRQATANGLIPVFCIGEDEAERNNNATAEVLAEQLQPVLQLLQQQPEAEIVLAYEPVWAIGTGQAASPAQAAAVHKSLQSQLDGVTAAKLPILYGGSVKPDNAKDFIAQAEIDGLLVGGASLQAESILEIFSI